MPVSQSQKSPLFRDSKHKDCCQISDDLRVILEQVRTECSSLRTQDRAYAEILQMLIELDESFQKQ